MQKYQNEETVLFSNGSNNILYKSAPFKMWMIFYCSLYWFKLFMRI